MRNYQTQIFLVEDNRGDVRLIQRALEDLGIPHSCSVAYDGEEAVSHLTAQDENGGFVNNKDLIILDLNLPKKSGLEVLKVIKSVPGLRHIPVVIFSSSEAPDDIRSAYDLHANCYIAKPFDFSEYSEVIRRIWDFWLSTVKLAQSGRK